MHWRARAHRRSGCGYAFALVQPWMVIALLMVACATLLIVAPRLHRRSLHRARRRHERIRLERVDALRDRPGTGEVPAPNPAAAARARDVLLLRGVRVEIVSSTGGVRLLHAAGDERAVVDALEAVADVEGSE